MNRVAAAVLLVGWSVMASAAQDAKPWRLDAALDSPDLFSLGGSYRVRYETLNHPYRAGATGSDEILVGRFLRNARVTLRNFYVNLEFEDSRQELADSGSALALYGSRSFDYGPTGIYGALARANLSSPGLRFEAKPLPNLSGRVGYRAVWLASSRDQYTTARLQDPTGNSGDFVGHQLDAQVQYTLLPGNLVLEFGGAYLAHGEFLEDAPNAPNEGDTTYIYASATATF